MAKQGSKKEYVLTDAEKYIIAKNARRLEAEKPKGYADILEYANKFSDLSKVAENFPQFPQNATISAKDAFAPYYGNQFDTQAASAMEYANQLNAQKDEDRKSWVPKITIDPAYYDQLSNKVPVKNAEVVPNYSVINDKITVSDLSTNNKTTLPDAKVNDRIRMSNPVSYATFVTDLSQKKLSENNYGSKDDFVNYLKTNLPNFYRDTLEHEIGHKNDNKFTFESIPVDLGYMSQNNHLVTGLGKVQREHYAITGQRFEHPEQFKSFVLSLAQAPNTEEAISPFSEEARRTLRPQIENAKNILQHQTHRSYLDKYDMLEQMQKNDRRWTKEARFLEESAQLIPALVTNSASTNYSS
jgi:hypothetical protein